MIPQDTGSKNIAYRDILSNIGQQLKSRQGLIAKRVAFVSLPLILTAVPLMYFGELTKDLSIPSEQKGIIGLILLGLVLFVGLPWAVIMGQVFKVERIIWIDSFFDNIPLTSKDSWNLAKKLFWPSIATNILAFLRYYVPAILLAIGLIALYIVLVATDVMTFNGLVLLILILGILAASMVYSYFIRIHLRYLMFLLVDNYKKEPFTYGSLFVEMRNLNRTTKSSEFGKMLVTVLGTDAAASATNAVIGVLNGAATSQLGAAGQAAGQAVAMYANEVVTTNKKYAQTVTFYVFYRVARELTYGNAQKINHELYSETAPSFQTIK